jgi:hypothetical protein
MVDEIEANNFHLKQEIDEVLQRQNLAGKNGSFPREVDLQFYLWRVHSIETVAQTFCITLTLTISWKEDNVRENIIPGKKEESNWILTDFQWNPQTQFKNLIEEDGAMKEEWIRVKAIDENNPGGGKSISKQEWINDIEKLKELNQPVRVTHRIKSKLTLSEAFELQDFPFDFQPLHIQIASTWDCYNVLLRFSELRPSAIEPSPLDSQEWEMVSPRLIAYNTECDRDDLPLLSLSSQSITGARYSRAYIALMAKRKPNYYMWNIYIMLLILGSLSFTVFSVHAEETGDRLGIMLTLVLALVAFKLVLAQSLPSISYLTMLDVYTLGSMILMFFISIFNAILPSLAMELDDLFFADRVIFLLSMALWVILNVWFLAKTLMLSINREKKVKKINHSFDLHRKSSGQKFGAHLYKNVI